MVPAHVSRQCILGGKKGRGELNSQSENQRLVWEAKNFGNITPGCQVVIEMLGPKLFITSPLVHIQDYYKHLLKFLE